MKRKTPPGWRATVPPRPEAREGRPREQGLGEKGHDAQKGRVRGEEAEERVAPRVASRGLGLERIVEQGIDQRPEAHEESQVLEIGRSVEDAEAGRDLVEVAGRPRPSLPTTPRSQRRPAMQRADARAMA